ncbi:hypothetical protein LTR94_037341, partial [Friedmanniomyces endolithicus]
PHRPPHPADPGRDPRPERLHVRPGRVPGGGRFHHADPGRAGPPVAAQPPRGGRRHARHHPARQGDLL